MPILGDISKYKIHLALPNNGHNPLDTFGHGYKETIPYSDWKEWNIDRSKKAGDSYYIMSFIEYDKKKRFYLFGGIWEIIKKGKEIRLSPMYKNFVGRLVVYSKERNYIAALFNLETYWDSLTVHELLSSIYKK